MDWTHIASGLAGGLGLFLLGMWLMTDGLKLSAGRALNRALEKWTNTPARGLASGMLITAAVQSSSAVTVAVIGFVNSGVLKLRQAAWVVFGSNVGTSMTGWIVALVGLKVRIDALALPIVAIGMFLRLTGPTTRRGAVGTALAGFGVLFVGLDMLARTFEGMAGSISPEAFAMEGVAGIAAFVVLGALLTVLTQSSSAAVAIVLTAAEGGVVGLSGAAAVVIGANLGTTSTALLATVGATPPAKRVAACHILFNVITGLVALAILPVLLDVGEVVRQQSGLDDSPAVTLALFHTTFNVLGVLLMAPIAPRLLRMLEARFRTQAEDDAQLQFLDDSVLAVPELAVRALRLELSRLTALTCDLATVALTSTAAAATEVERRHESLEALQRRIGVWCGRLGRHLQPADVAARVPPALGALQFLTNAREYARATVEIGARVDPLPVELSTAVAVYEDAARTFLATVREIDVDAGLLDELIERLAADIVDIERALLLAGSTAGVDVAPMGEHLQRIHVIRRTCGQLRRAIDRLREMDTDAPDEPSTSVAPAAPSAASVPAPAAAVIPSIGEESEADPRADV